MLKTPNSLNGFARFLGRNFPCTQKNQILNFVNKILKIVLSFRTLGMAWTEKQQCRWNGEPEWWTISVGLQIFCFFGTGIARVPEALQDLKPHQICWWPRRLRFLWSILCALRTSGDCQPSSFLSVFLSVKIDKNFAHYCHVCPLLRKIARLGCGPRFHFRCSFGGGMDGDRRPSWKFLGNCTIFF